MEYKVKELEKTKDLYKFEISLDYKEIEPFKEEAYKELAPTIKLAGFRPGKAPRAQIEAKLGAKLVTEALNKLIGVAAFEVINKEGYKPAFSPEYTLKDIDIEKGIVFEISFVQYPIVKLGDFKSIEIKKEDPKVEQKDVDMVIRSVIRSSLSVDKIKELAGIKAETKKAKTEKSKKADKDEANHDHDHSHDGHTHDHSHADHNHSHGDHDHTHDHDHDHSHDDELGDFELNDKLIEELKYEKEKTLKELRETVEEKLKSVKANQMENDYITKVVKEAVKLSKFEIPEEFIKREVGAYENQFTSRLEELKLDVNTYLATQGTTIDEQRKTWRTDAEEKIGVDLVLITLADEHKAVASDEEVDTEIEAITDASTKEAYSKSDSAKEYVRTVITRQRGLNKLMEIVQK